jgi:hypothetical protein
MNVLRYGFAVAALLGVIGMTEQLKAQQRHTTALIGATVIDGTGAPPVPDAVIANGRILQAGARSEVPIPPDAESKGSGANRP